MKISLINIKSKKIILPLVFLFAATSVFAQSETTDSSENTGHSTIVAPHPVATDEQYRPHIGLLAGVMGREGQSDGVGEVGFDVGYQPYIPFGLGAEFNLTTTNSEKRDSVLVKGTYHFGGDIPVIKDSYVGAGVGGVFKSDGTEFALAPLIGFDIPVAENTLGERISLGANLKQMIVGGSNDDTLSVRAVAKYWF